jgi:hypothetical protein
MNAVMIALFLGNEHCVLYVLLQSLAEWQGVVWDQFSQQERVKLAGLYNPTVGCKLRSLNCTGLERFLPAVTTNVPDNPENVYFISRCYRGSLAVSDVVTATR